MDRGTSMEAQLWAPSDLRTSRCKEKRLMQRMKVFIEELDKSRFYHHFRHILRTSSIFEHVRKVLGKHTKMGMVIYGIGSFESCEHSALQLSLAVLMQRDFKWIGEIQVFDPILSTNECQILDAIGCCALNFNEEGMRKALKPTLFFMPHCGQNLYDNLLQANWNPDLLSNVVIFGNTFHNYLGLNYMFPIAVASRFTNEFMMETRNPRLQFIDDLSWMFFDLDLQFLNNILTHNRCRNLRRRIDLQVYSWTELRLKEKVENYINNLESSQFYYNLRDKLQTPPISQHLDTIMMRSKSKMKMVICDIGSIESPSDSILWLSLAIFMKRHFEWIGDIQVFEQYLSATEAQVYKYFGCIVLSLDEYRRSWQALKPTIFFVPGYSTPLYNNLLEVNFKSNLLSNIVLFGDSISTFELKKYSYIDVENSMRYYEAVGSLIKGVRIKTLPDDICLRSLLHDAFEDSSEWEDFLISLYSAFNYSTWQFFGVIDITEVELQFMNEFLQKGCHISLLN